MPDAGLVAEHYSQGSLVEAIREGIQRAGKTVGSIQVDDLGPVDEFHIGGRAATESFLDQLDIDASHDVLDVGCGLGGSSRFAAARYGCRVTGVDLTHAFVEAGNELSAWVGLSDRVNLAVEDATSLPHAAETFDRVYMMHVGMNIADKASLASEIHRVTRPGGRIGIYDVMTSREGDLTFPVPWAMGPEGSSVASPVDYRSALEAAGFRLLAERDRRDFALAFFAQLQANAAKAGGAPALGLHIVMGPSAPIKINNMVANIERKLIAPVEIVAEKTG